MNCDYYSVLYKTIVLAEHMTIGNALLFVEALFNKYFNEPDVEYIIKKEPTIIEAEREP